MRKDMHSVMCVLDIRPPTTLVVGSVFMNMLASNKNWAYGPRYLIYAVRDGNNNYIDLNSLTRAKLMNCEGLHICDCDSLNSRVLQHENIPKMTALYLTRCRITSAFIWSLNTHIKLKVLVLDDCYYVQAKGDNAKKENTRIEELVVYNCNQTNVADLKSCFINLKKFFMI